MKTAVKNIVIYGVLFVPLLVGFVACILHIGLRIGYRRGGQAVLNFLEWTKRK